MKKRYFYSSIFLIVCLVVTGACSHQTENKQGSSHTENPKRNAAKPVIPLTKPATDDTAQSTLDHLGSVGQSQIPADEKYRELVIGTWKDKYQGQRTMVIRPDGSATMVVELEGLSAKLYTERMTFNEKWSIVEGQLKLLAVDGKPAGHVNLILKLMGNSSVQKILELTKDRMLLLDPDGKTKYDWHKSAGE